MKTLCRLKFTTAPNSPSHMIVPVKINATGPYYFILDTGASTVCVSQTTAKALKLKGGKKREAMSASGLFDIKLIKTKSISLSKALRKNITVAVMDMKDISEKLGCDIEGILGYDFLKSYILTINYPKKEITIKR